MTEAVTEPKTIDQTDEMLTELTKRGGRAVKMLLAFLMVIVVVLAGAVAYLLRENYYGTAKINNIVTSRTADQCNFDYYIGTIPITSDSGKLGVEVVAGAREAYVGNECTPALPPASAYFISLAKKYDVKVTDGSS
jgi:hypothetical protein